VVDNPYYQQWYISSSSKIISDGSLELLPTISIIVCACFYVSGSLENDLLMLLEHPWFLGRVVVSKNFVDLSHEQALVLHLKVLEHESTCLIGQLDFVPGNEEHFVPSLDLQQKTLDG
jgi:hypothetical protein